MPDSLNTISEKAGMSPGTLLHVGDVIESESRISLVNYNKTHIEHKQIYSIDELLEYKSKETLTWVNIEGIHNVELIASIGQMFNIHTLVLEDILNAHQRPKFEEAEGYLYLVLKSLSLENSGFNVNYEQVSVVVFKNFVFTFKEKQDDLFAPILKRLHNTQGRLRILGTDYLTYAILDLIVDMNFMLLDSLDVITDEIEEELLTDPSAQTLVSIQSVKRELLYIRKSVAPLRELLTEILRSDTALIHKKNHPYFRDVYDHVVHITEEIETYKDILMGLLDIYISSVSNKMNEVMKLLTVFASIFIPLTFLAGVYGMNFEYMPELKWKWAYPALWGLFTLFTIGALRYFKKKKWL